MPRAGRRKPSAHARVVALRITITRHGHAVAALVLPGAASRRDVREVIEGIKEFRNGHTRGNDLTIRQLIDEGRTR